MSLYQLTIEPDTVFHSRAAQGRLAVPHEEMAATLYEVTQALCHAAGLPAYEISNHAIAGHHCRHNRAIWHGGDYVGIGPGAHGRCHHRRAQTCQHGA
jgi:oxygen-independent coproporphyrinogen-3 oxidase